MPEYSESIFEMASVRPKNLNNVDILLTVNPDIHRDGLAYFKMYNSNSIDSATTVWRINFNKPEIIKIHKGIIKASTEMNVDYKKKLIKYLSLPCKENTKYTVWDALKYHWNDEMGFCGNYDFEEYMNGDVDNLIQNQKCYLPSNLQMPNYKNL